MKRFKRQKHHNDAPQRNTTGASKGWKKCPHAGCKFNTRSQHKLGQHIRWMHKEDTEAKTKEAREARIKEAIATLPVAGKRRGRPKSHLSTMDGLDSLIASVKARLHTTDEELGKFMVLQHQKAQLDRELTALVETRAALEGKKHG